MNYGPRNHQKLAPDTSIHFIGIGGAGMSAIARVFFAMGYKVSGSDLKDTQNVQDLICEGIEVVIGHTDKNVNGKNIIVRSTAIPVNNVELRAAEELGIKVLQRAEALQLIAAEQARPVFVAGAHGKTTTTSMIAAVMVAGKMQPTCIVGGELNDIGSNALHGSGDVFVAEADESDGSFLYYSPKVAVITNIEGDHFDHYQTFTDIQNAYVKFLQNILPGGCAIICGDDKNAVTAAEALTTTEARDRIEIVTYGEGEQCNIRAVDIQITTTQSSYDVLSFGKHIGKFTLQVPGRHNVLNSLAAIAVGNWCGIPVADIVTGLAQYSGVKRRFQYLGDYHGATLIDDYAHHPTEIRATISSALERKKGRLIAVFQPHRYSRTYHLADDFAMAFGQTDELIITDVYGSGEAPMPGVNGKLIVDGVLNEEPGKRIAYLPRVIDVIDYIRLSARKDDMIVFMGAGNINVAGHTLVGEG